MIKNKRGMMKVGIVACSIFALFFSLYFVSAPEPENPIMDGKSIYIENSYGKIWVENADSEGFTNHEQTMNITWNGVSSSLDFAFEFDENNNKKLINKNAYIWLNYSHAKKTDIYGNVSYFKDCFGFLNGNYGIINDSLGWCKDSRCLAVNSSELCYKEYSFDYYSTDENKARFIWNKTEVTGYTYPSSFYYDYKNINDMFQKIEYNGNTYYFIKDVFFNTGETKRVKINYQTEIGTSGKWSVFVKKNSDTLASAISNLRYIRLDPTWNSSFESGLVSWWKFDEGSGLLASDELGVKDIVIIDGNWSDTGIENGALNTTDTGINADEMINSTGFGNMSICTWLYRDAVYPNLNKDLFYKSDANNNGEWKGIIVTNGNFYFDLADSDGNSIYGSAPQHALINSSWNHWCATINQGAFVTLYHNGASYDATAVKGFLFGPVLTYGQWVKFGTSASTIKNLKVDETGVWNRILSDSEISDLYNTGTGIFYGSTPPDTSAPNISIEYPINATLFNFRLINVNFSVSGDASYCKWMNETGLNHTLASCGANLTTIKWEQGWNIPTIWVNDSAGNLNSSYKSFYVDSISPFIEITTPTNNTNQTDTSLNINFTRGDINLASVWWTMNEGATNLSIGLGENITNQTWAQGYWNVTIYDNDTLGNLNQTASSFLIDNVKPLISFESKTYIDGKNVSSRYVYANITWTELNLANITFYIYNETSLVNQTFSTDPIYQVNWTLTRDGNYTYQANITDSANNKNGTELRFIRLDTRAPDLNMTFPMNTSYNINVSNITYMAVDNGAGLGRCWFMDSTGVNSTPTTCGSSFLGTISYEESQIQYVYANDSVGNLNESFNTFYKDTIFPVVNNSVISNTEYSVGDCLTPYIFTGDYGVSEKFLKDVTWTIYDGGSVVFNQSNATTTKGTYVAPLVCGRYVINVTGIDTLDNTRQDLINIRIFLDTGTPYRSDETSGGGGVVLQQLPKTETKVVSYGAVCLPLKQQLAIMVEETKAKPTFTEKVMAIWDAFWNFVVCAQVSSIVP